MTVKEFFEANGCTDEEKQQCYRYLLAIRVMPYVDELRSIGFKIWGALKYSKF